MCWIRLENYVIPTLILKELVKQIIFALTQEQPEKLNWRSETSFNDMIKKMVLSNIDKLTELEKS